MEKWLSRNSQWVINFETGDVNIERAEYCDRVAWLLIDRREKDSLGRPKLEWRWKWQEKRLFKGDKELYPSNKNLIIQ